jgi:hypothetical protein
LQTNNSDRVIQWQSSHKQPTNSITSLQQFSFNNYFSFSNPPFSNLPPAISLQPKNPSSPSASLLYPVVNKEVEQQFSGRGMTLQQKKPAVLASLNINNFGKAAELHLAW